MFSIQAMQEEIRREEHLEVAAALSLLSFRDSKLFDGMKVKPHMPTLSRALNAVLSRLLVPEMRLCDEVAAKVLKVVAEYPSFRTIMDTEKDRFRQYLQIYVARQILLAKCRQGNVISPLARRAAVVFLEMRLLESSVAAGVNRAADKFLEGGLDPDGLVEVLSDVVRKEYEELVARLEAEALPETGRSELLQLPEAAIG
ncbi:NAD-glutamate dehydrogenase [Desulfofundulus sp. TPOSR]|uniref:NAD-glutamate dehydrogenase n=1 Tax=Desulfofundulus sp. TPOSR TaxID=2714340 RepID=UPI00140941A7|nr:NAD-glutamate dehydrogenase [Desulfofundulus sp. TPOSR]NHM28053.1 NAD-glutamate dehydrogenase [Desulfofundulus sp. TPOSR]